MPRLLLADRIKRREDSFLAPLLPALEQQYETRFITAGPGEELAAAIAWADIVWLEWCWPIASGPLRNSSHCRPILIWPTTELSWSGR